LGPRLLFTWNDETGSSSGQSNELNLQVGGPGFSPLLQATTNERTLTFSSPSFAPNEPVGLWYNTPDGRAVPLTTAFADSDGNLTATLDTTGLPSGSYSIVAYGHWTEFTALTPFTLPTAARAA
ncbi:MAG: hypothetical protein HGA65_21000, partial [Oscillochloris sp.]|nr:hypothetical protein [Oscillochloris sp.]